MIVYITQTSVFFFFFLWVNIFVLDIHLGTQKYSLPQDASYKPIHGFAVFFSK